MRKSVLSVLSISALLLIFTGSLSPIVAGAERIEKDDVAIGSGAHKSEVLFANKGDELYIKVRSDIPVDVYVISGEKYNSTDFKSSKLSRADVIRRHTRNVDINWTKPDDQTYHLVIHNDDNETAVVDYSYPDIVSEDVEEFFDKISMFCLAGVVLAIVIIIAIIVLIVVVLK